MPGPEVEQSAESSKNVSKTMELAVSPEATVVDKFLMKAGIDSLNANRKWELIRQLSLVELTSPNAKPEENTKIQGILIKQLEEWGYSITDIYSDSLRDTNDVQKNASKIDALTRKTNMPTDPANYTSNVGVYNFETKRSGNTFSYLKNRFDEMMDKLSTLIQSAADHGCSIFAALSRKPMRKKADMNSIEQNIKELGLESHFTAVRKGSQVMEIQENISDVRSGAFLDDLLRLRKNSPFLKKLDPRAVIRMATKMIDQVHKKSGRGIGELLASDIVIQLDSTGKVVGTRLALPDMKYDESIETNEQKAIDMLDFAFSCGSAGYQEGGDGPNGLKLAEENIKEIINNYSDQAVKIKMLELLNSQPSKPSYSTINATRLGFNRVGNRQNAFEEIRNIVKRNLGGGNP